MYDAGTPVHAHSPMCFGFGAFVVPSFFFVDCSPYAQGIASGPGVSVLLFFLLLLLLLLLVVVATTGIRIL